MEAAAVNIAKAKELKAQGNEAFKAGNYNAAMVHYHQIFMYVHGFSEGSGASAQSMPGQTTKPVDAETMAQLRELKVVHFSNLAMCHLKLGNVEKARDNSSKALAIDAKNIKSLFRRGKCHSTLGALDEAKADFDQILSLEPENREAMRELHALKQKFKEHDKKEKKKFAGMFDKLSADAENASSSSNPPAPAPTPAPSAPTAAAPASSTASRRAPSGGAATSAEPGSRARIRTMRTSANRSLRRKPSSLQR